MQLWDKIMRPSLFLLFLMSFFLNRAVSFQGEEINRNQFPDGFLFGTATSSYQVEGAVFEDGKGVSNWDVFSHIPGKIEGGDNGDVADDHYHRYQEDIELMHSLGISAYRFSISWARILPRGMFGDVNPKGIVFYNKIIDKLLQKGIKPFVTLNHFDFPQELEERYGSWLSPLMQDDFAYFADICFRSFGDRVKYWVTINEPNHFADFGYLKGISSPGRCSAPFGNCSRGNSEVEPLVVVHNMILSHAKATGIYRNHYQANQGGAIGLILYAFMYIPISNKEVDIKAADRALAFNVAWVLDPLIHGDYPSEMRYYLGPQLPKFSAEESKLLKHGLDFIGVNHYSTLYTKDCIHSLCDSGGHAIEGFVFTTSERDGLPIGELTANPWFFVVPTGMEKIIGYIKTRYINKPMFVTENGVSPKDQSIEHASEQLKDYKRIEFHKSYLSSLAKAIRDGADVRGYFVWSFMDNFEWQDGYSLRFGLHYVDYQTLKRTPKLSASWFRNFLTNGTQIYQGGLTRNHLKNKCLKIKERIDVE